MGLLQENLALYAEILTELKADRQRLIDFDMVGIVDSNQRKETIATKLQALEGRRLALIDGYAREAGLSPRDLTFSRLGSAAPEAIQAQLMELRSRLRALLREVRYTGEDNALLIQRSQGFLQRWLALLAHWVDQQGVYLPSGQLQGGRKAGQLLSGQI